MTKGIKLETMSPSSSTPYQLHQSNNGGKGKASSNSSTSGNGKTGSKNLKNTGSTRRDAILRDLSVEYPEYRYYMTEQALTRIDTDDTLSDNDVLVIQRLACRKFHMPGNSFWEDYFYWFSNNHPFLCFWLADPRHPLGYVERILNLVASLAFGLAATCCVVLWFHYEENRDFDNVAFTIPGIQKTVTVGMLALILFGGPLHVVFDLSIYFVQACPLCRAGGLFDSFPVAFQTCWLWLGANVAFLITVASLSLAINVMLIRASINDGDGNDEDITTRPEHYSFMLLYLLEVVVANFVVFPIGTLTVFSGILGCCGRMPGLGGRPYQVRKHQLLMQRQQAQARVDAKESPARVKKAVV